jgi:hypothetical protein
VAAAEAAAILRPAHALTRNLVSQRPILRRTALGENQREAETATTRWVEVEAAVAAETEATGMSAAVETGTVEGLEAAGRPTEGLGQGYRFAVRRQRRGRTGKVEIEGSFSAWGCKDWDCSLGFYWV